MPQRAERVRELSEAIAGRRWNACPELVYRILYGVPSAVVLPIAAEQIARMLPHFEKRWPGVTWPREIIEDPKRWIAHSGRSIPDSPERDTVAEARFVFSLDALLLAAAYPDDKSVLTSSCACAIREIVSVGVELRAGESAFGEDVVEECEGCGAASKEKPARGPESPIEYAHSREWQTVLDSLLARKLQDWPGPESPEHMEADLEAWEDHEGLLIVPEAA
jgi:hypothetical protein